MWALVAFYAKYCNKDWYAFYELANLPSSLYISESISCTINSTLLIRCVVTKMNCAPQGCFEL